MREIKFRAWANWSKVMFYPNSDDGWELRDGKLSPLPNTVLMQFTGLKDKNGKEIYEGDIVRGTTDEWDQNTKTANTVAVKWGVNCGFSPFSEYDADCGTETSPNKVEVIGNIYENPELITPAN